MAKGKTVEKAGFQTGGYIVKKGTPVTMGATIGYIFNRMPPGMNIENQDCADIRAEPMKEIVNTRGYPGDGWSGATANPEDVGSAEGPGKGY